MYCSVVQYTEKRFYAFIGIDIARVGVLEAGEISISNFKSREAKRNLFVFQKWAFQGNEGLFFLSFFLSFFSESVSTKTVPILCLQKAGIVFGENTFFASIPFPYCSGNAKSTSTVC